MSPEELKKRNRERLQAKREQLAANKELTKPVMDLSEKVKELTQSIKTSGIDDAAEAIQATVNTLTKLSETIKKTDDKNVALVAQKVAELAQKIDQIDISPQINVDPKLEVDFTPLLNAMPKSESKGIDLEDFRAQDLDEEEDDVQYVGFVAPNGNWMIIRNDVVGKNMRFKFGLKDYQKAWPLFATYKYDTLDKAINEIKA